MGIEEELVQLIGFMKQMGKPNPSGQLVVKYGDFVTDPTVTNTFEAPFGLLKSARKRKIVAFDGEILLSPMHDRVDITLLRESV
ncbi:hypothetical protein ABBQ38_004023 [Trebouxia sp. C0009 RCD-2024]